MSLSPAELAKVLIDAQDPSLPVIVVGPSNDPQQQEGVVSIMQAGDPVAEKYVPLQGARIQVRCLASTLAVADEIGWKAKVALHDINRAVVEQPSDGNTYLIHYSLVTGGPSMHYDSKETWEVLLFAEMVIASDPVVTS